MQFIKKIIREELERVLATLNETDFYGQVGSELGHGKVIVGDNPKENIIYDYDNGKMFAENNLAVDIAYLDRYNLVEYLPKSSTEEMWTFEFDTVIGTTLIVDIKRQVHNLKSFWKLSFGQLYKGEKMPTLMSEIDYVEGYDNFINIVNQKVASKIDPSKF